MLQQCMTAVDYRSEELRSGSWIGKSFSANTIDNSLFSMSNRSIHTTSGRHWASISSKNDDVETKPNSVMNAHDPVGSPTPEIAPSSKSDLLDLNLTTTMLVGGNEQASDLVGEIDEPADLVSARNERDLIGKLVIKVDLVGDEAQVAELVETNNDKEEIAEIQTEVDGAADDVTKMTFTIAGDVDGLPRPGIVAATLVVVMEREITNEASYEINYVAAMTKLSSKSPAFASAKKSRREAIFVKDHGKPHMAVRHCRQLGFKATSRHDGYSKQRGGGCEEDWSRRVARRRWQRRAPAKSQRQRNLDVRCGEAITTMVRREVESTRSEGKTEQGGGCEEAWSRRVAKRRRWRSVAEKTSPWAAARLSASRRVAMRRGGSKARRDGGCMEAESSGDTWEGQLESGGDRGWCRCNIGGHEGVTARARGLVLQRRKLQCCDLSAIGPGPSV